MGKPEAAGSLRGSNVQTLGVWSWLQTTDRCWGLSKKKKKKKSEHNVLSCIRNKENTEQLQFCFAFRNATGTLWWVLSPQPCHKVHIQESQTDLPVLIT
jgi:hypothetical protein